MKCKYCSQETAVVTTMQRAVKNADGTEVEPLQLEHFSRQHCQNPACNKTTAWHLHKNFHRVTEDWEDGKVTSSAPTQAPA